MALSDLVFPTKIRVGGPRGELVNAIGWMNSGGRCRGQVMLTLRDERPHALYGVGLARAFCSVPGDSRSMSGLGKVAAPTRRERILPSQISSKMRS